MAVAANAKGVQSFQKRLCRSLPGILGEHHAAHIQPKLTECINQAQHFVIIGNTQVSAHFICLNITGIDGDNDFYIVFQLLQHANFAVRLKPRQHTRRMKIVKQLAAKLQIQFAAKLRNAFTNLL